MADQNETDEVRQSIADRVELEVRRQQRHSPNWWLGLLLALAVGGAGGFFSGQINSPPRYVNPPQVIERVSEVPSQQTTTRYPVYPPQVIEVPSQQTSPFMQTTDDAASKAVNEIVLEVIKGSAESGTIHGVAELIAMVIEKKKQPTTEQQKKFIDCVEEFKKILSAKYVSTLSMRDDFNYREMDEEIRRWVEDCMRENGFLGPAQRPPR
jgi:hypothetical protein